MRLPLLLLLSCTVTVFALDEEERERLHEGFSSALTELSESHKRLNEHAGTAQVVVPPGVMTVVSKRRTQAAEWLRRMGATTSEFPVDEADMFRDGLYALRSRVDLVAGWLESVNTLAERWPQAAGTKELDRYRAFVTGGIQQRLQEIAADAEATADDDLYYRQQTRHELILNLVDNEAQMTEQMAKLPQNTPVVREYRDHRTALRTVAEAGLRAANPTDDAELNRDQQILWLLEELVSLAQERDERLSQREQPPGPLVMAALTACQVSDEKALRAVIAHHRAQMPDDPAWHRQQDALRREQQKLRNVTQVAWEWMYQEDGIRDQRTRLQEQLSQLPPALQPAAKKRLTELETKVTDAFTALDQSIREGKRLDAVRAKAAVRLLNQDFEALAQDLDFQQDRLNQENELKERLGASMKPAIQQQADALWNTLAAARARQQQAERDAIAAELANELANVATDEARVAVDLARQEVDLARELLDLRRGQIIDAVENPQPKPEGDPKF